MLNHLKLLFLSTCFLVGSCFQSTAATIVPDTTKLTVGLAGSPPFNLKDEKGGIALEIWSSVTEGLGWDYQTVHYKSVPEALKALRNGKIDVVVGPSSITSDRIEKVDFSQPYYYSGVSILSLASEPTFWDRISPFFSMKLLYAIGVFLSILAIVGALLWLAERKKSPDQFPEKPIAGIGNGMWLAIVTMSTTGYGDKAPVTLMGRIIAGTWMIVSIIFATSMVAGIASTLTLSGMGNTTITEATQLNGKKVATLSDYIATSFQKDFRIKPIPVETLGDAYALLKNKKVDAVLFDRPQLLYYQQNHPDYELYVSHAVYIPKGYGFAFPVHSELVKKVNYKMLELNETGVVKKIISSWIGNSN